jgi:hypothetical protein
MQIIETKYLSASNHRGSRISAKASGCKQRVTLGYDHGLNAEDNHKRAALALMEKLDWVGKYVGGHTENGMVFVCADPRFSYSVER